MKTDDPIPIFVPELDDDATKILGKDTSEEAILAYLLFGGQIVLHPAYEFQNPKANKLVFGLGGKLLQPPMVQIILGDSTSVEQYLPNRTNKLSEAEAKENIEMPELDQYRRYSKEQIRELSQILDQRFLGDKGVFRIAWSRDLKFRHLVREELKRYAYLGDHLAPILLFHRSYLGERRVKYLIEKLISITKDSSRLVSCDTILGYLKKNGFRANELTLIEHRLHILHWEAVEGEGLRVPILNRLLRGKLDPYDHQVFWQATCFLIGSEDVEKMFKLPWADKLSTCIELRNDPTWQHYVAIYRSIVETTSAEMSGINQQSVMSELRKRFPSKTKFTLDHMSKLELAALAISFGVSSIGLLFPPITTISLIGTAATGISSTLVIRRWRQVLKEYAETDLADLKYKLRSLFRRFRN